jgi:hypothetical protein
MSTLWHADYEAGPHVYREQFQKPGYDGNNRYAPQGGNYAPRGGYSGQSGYAPRGDYIPRSQQPYGIQRGRNEGIGSGAAAAMGLGGGLLGGYLLGNALDHGHHHQHQGGDAAGGGGGFTAGGGDFAADVGFSELPTHIPLATVLMAAILCTRDVCCTRKFTAFG